MTNNGNGNGGNQSILRLILDFLMYLGQGIWADVNPEDPQEDVFYDSEQLGGVEPPDSKDKDERGNGKSRNP
jgi:hypothetical protein